jgi:hypothetical protein
MTKPAQLHSPVKKTTKQDTYATNTEVFTYIFH